MHDKLTHLRTLLCMVAILLLLICGLPMLAQATLDAVHALRYRHVAFAALSTFSFDQEHGRLADIPASIRELDGKRISIDGFMIPLDPADSVKRFAFVDHVTSGDIGPKPTLQELIIVDMPDGKATPYTSDRIRVDGRLHVSVKMDDGYVYSVYSMDADQVTLLNAPSPYSASRWIGTLIGPLLLALTYAITIWKRNRTRKGFCLGCGYDLRATPGRCPECGKIAPATALTAT